jgi:hypothetical protein
MSSPSALGRARQPIRIRIEPIRIRAVRIEQGATA